MVPLVVSRFTLVPIPPLFCYWFYEPPTVATFVVFDWTDVLYTMHLPSTLAFLATLAGTLSVSASQHAPKRNHAAIDVSKREETGMSLFKRIDDARLTYYAVSPQCQFVRSKIKIGRQDGLGACGKTNKPSDFVSNLPFHNAK